MKSALDDTFLTIFTPTYNRAHLLQRLFESIASQVNPGDPVEWLVIDDGSTDGTAEVVSRLAQNRPDLVRFKRVENGGKHRAINLGVAEAKGDMFFIVDSDDYLPDGALSWVLSVAKKIAHLEFLAGFGGLMIGPDGRIVGDAEFPVSPVVSDVIDRRQRLGVVGDIAKIVKTEILRSFAFPEIGGEKFIAESIVWNRISERYRFMYFNEIIYVADYQSDGLSAKSLQNRIRNPVGAAQLYIELANNKRANFVTRLKALTNYWRFTFHRGEGFFQQSLGPGHFVATCLVIPLAYAMFRRDLRLVGKC